MLAMAQTVAERPSSNAQSQDPALRPTTNGQTTIYQSPSKQEAKSALSRHAHDPYTPKASGLYARELKYQGVHESHRRLLVPGVGG